MMAARATAAALAALLAHPMDFCMTLTFCGRLPAPHCHNYPF
jgi:hypothetical protein